MKKAGVLHSELSRIIAGLGHTQTLVIADYGLPVPSNVQLIDLAISREVPSFIDVLSTVLEELTVESATIATEIDVANIRVFNEIKRLMACPLEKIPHETFKGELQHAVAVVRTGEHSPYANIILRAGVVF